MRGIIISDLHCGHELGITPPSWQWRLDKSSQSRIANLARLQRETWKIFWNPIKKQEYHFAFWIGDLVDGPGKKSGGAEHLTTAQDDQTDIAAEIVMKVGAKYNYIVRGTPYHVGDSDEWEDDVADKVKYSGMHVEIGDQLFPEVGGVVFDLKHHTGKTSVPHGITTGPKKAHVHNLLRAERKMAPKADVTIRGHIHEYNFIKNRNWTGITMPALQAMGCRYARKLDSQVDYGFLEVEVRGGKIVWHDENVREVLSQAAQTTIIPSS